MTLCKSWKIIILLTALAIQGVMVSSLSHQPETGQRFDQLIDEGHGSALLQIAGETPEPGSILLLALGGLWLGKQNHKNRR